MPSNEPLWQLWSSRREWRGWVTQLIASAPLAISTPPAIDTLPATGGPDLWDSEKNVPRQHHAMGKLMPDQKVPRWPPSEGELEISTCMNIKGCPGWLHTKGVLLRNRPSHPAPQDGNVRCHFLKGGYHCWQKSCRTGWGNTHVMPRQKWSISCPHHYGGPRQHKKWWIGQDHERRPKPAQSKRKMSPVAPGWGRAPPGRCQCRRWPPSANVIITPTTTVPWISGTLPLHASDWIEWCARYVQMPFWWEELTPITSQANHLRICLKGACFLWGT